MGINALTGETAIITGGASGIGKAIAQEFVESGATVFLVDLNQPKLAETARELGERGTVRTLAGSLRDPDLPPRIVEEAFHQCGRVDILVNCAGIYPSKPALEITMEEWDAVYDLNVKATFFLTQAVARRMVAEGIDGRILNVTSTASEVARPGVAHYCSSKAAVKMFTKVLALEFGRLGLRINALAPGLVETETLLRTLTSTAARKEHADKIATTPIERAATVEEIAAAALYLCSRSSGYVTGQTLFVDGGYEAGRFYPD